MIPLRKYLNMVRIEKSYLDLGEVLILVEHRNVIKKDFTRKELKGEY